MKEATHIKPHEMNFIQVWLSGLINPIRSLDELKGKPAPQWGLLIEAVGFVRLLRLGIVPAIVLALIINALYIALAMIFIR